MYKEINKNNAGALVIDAWAMAKNRIENGYPVSSEKSMVFLFSQNLIRLVDPQTELMIDFEAQLLKTLIGESKYLDLLIYTTNSFKIALEFKLPRKNSLGNSNQTQTRKSVYRDIARLNYLVKNKINSINAGYFLFACNEDAYLNNSNLKQLPYFVTREGYIYDPILKISVDGMELTDISFQFTWDNIVFDDLKGKYVKKGKFAYLKPVEIKE